MYNQKNFSFVVLVIASLLSGSGAKIYNDNLSLSSRVPGDQLLLSGRAIQKFDFPATVYVEVRYPDVLPNSNYILTHVSCNGKDDTGYVDAKLDQGGPGSDNIKMKVIFESILNGDFQYNLYGKKK